MSKLNWKVWKQELYGVKVIHGIIGFENCREDKKSRYCFADPKMNCFECELCKSCDKCLKRKTQIKYYSTEANEPERLPTDDNNFMLHYYIEGETGNVEKRS